MKPATKAKVLKALDKIQGIVEKCGGPGGTPGPCPIGNKPSGGGGDHSSKMRAVAPHAQKARASSEKAHVASMQAPEAGHSRKMAKQAFDAARLATHNGLVRAPTVGDATKAYQSHLKAASAHASAAQIHQNVGGGKGAHGKAVKAHQTAAEHHNNAASRYKAEFAGVSGF